MKNIKIIIFLSSLILFLSACGTTPDTETHYFVLSPNQNTISNRVVTGSIELKPIQLAKFLDQPGIVLQTDQHKIKVANFHRWGEPLKKNIHRYISQSTGIASNTQLTQSLEVHIQQFHGTHDGSALVSGYWKFKNIHHPFSYQAPLAKTGYAELVKQLAIQLDQLCMDIADQINK